MKKPIAGKDYDYTLCSRCEVWILTENIHEGTHKDCDKFFKGLEIRKRATERVLKLI